MTTKPTTITLSTNPHEGRLYLCGQVSTTRYSPILMRLGMTPTEVAIDGVRRFLIKDRSGEPLEFYVPRYAHRLLVGHAQAQVPELRSLVVEVWRLVGVRRGAVRFFSRATGVEGS